MHGLVVIYDLGVFVRGNVVRRTKYHFMVSFFLFLMSISFLLLSSLPDIISTFRETNLKHFKVKNAIVTSARPFARKFQNTFAVSLLRIQSLWHLHCFSSLSIVIPLFCTWDLRSFFPSLLGGSRYFLYINICAL